jgi:hypothetical protein
MQNLACHLVLAAIISGAGCGSAPGPTAPGAAPQPMSAEGGRIVVLDDSLAVSPSRAQSFPAELQVRLNARGGGS